MNSIQRWREIDIHEADLLEVTELEKQSVKSYVLKSRKQSVKWKYIAMSFIILLTAAIATSVISPATAARVPLFNYFFNMFSDNYSRYTQFPLYSDDINQSHTSNGITMTIDQAIFDGREITVTYKVKTDLDQGIVDGSEEDLDAQVGLEPTETDFIKVNGAKMHSSSWTYTKVSSDEYVGLIHYTPLFPDNEVRDVVEVTMKPNRFFNSSHSIIIEGDWNFNFSLQKVPTEIMPLNLVSEIDGVSFNIVSIELSSVSTKLEYIQTINSSLLLSEWGSVYPAFTIYDDKGNIYFDFFAPYISSQYGLVGGSTIIFGAIDKQAKQLFIKPIVTNDYSVEKKIELEELIVELK